MIFILSQSFLLLFCSKAQFGLPVKLEAGRSHAGDHDSSDREALGTDAKPVLYEAAVALCFGEVEARVGQALPWIQGYLDDRVRGLLEVLVDHRDLLVLLLAS